MLKLGQFEKEIKKVTIAHFSSDDDIIRISHTAKSRFAFALGAVIAEFLVDKNEYMI